MMVVLTDEDVRFFAEQGYLIKQSVLDPVLMKKGRERMWSNMPPPMEPDKPETWIGPLDRCDDSGSNRHGYTWKYREPGCEDWMIRLLAKDPSVWGMAERLLGEGTIETPDRIRGIYCVMPEGDAPERPTTCHVDAHPFHLGVVGYINDVGPGSGGFTVWPCSHKTFYYDFKKQYTMDATDQYDIDKAMFDTTLYTDCSGKAGDIVFWHHRIGHSVGHNRSMRIRQAVLYDFRKKDLNEEERPCDDMWRDWPGVRAVLNG